MAPLPDKLNKCWDFPSYLSGFILKAIVLAEEERALVREELKVVFIKNSSLDAGVDIEVNAKLAFS